MRVRSFGHAKFNLPLSLEGRDGSCDSGLAARQSIIASAYAIEMFLLDFEVWGLKNSRAKRTRLTEADLSSGSEGLPRSFFELVTSCDAGTT